jgi:transcriptional regulator GlxA family with amidase domain
VSTSALLITDRRIRVFVYPLNSFGEMAHMGTNDKKRGKSVTTSVQAPVEIGLVLYPDCQLAAVHGLTDLFRVANRLGEQLIGSGRIQIRISHWKLDEAGREPVRVFDTHTLAHGPLTALILPPSLDAEPGGDGIARHLCWLINQHSAGTILCSVCAGAFLLAEAGLLNGRRATTHWIHAQTLAARFPAVRIDTEKLIIDDGDIITAGGVMAWVDLGLNLIERFLSPTVMLATARFFLVDAAGREQRFYSSFAPQLAHGDKPVLKIQHWLQQHIAESPSVDLMATRVNLVKRTFLRRFHKATGMTPTRYLQHLRVGKARESLEFSMSTINEIAWMIGYEDPGSFRKVFQHIMGLSPGAYRRRFGIARQGQQGGNSAKGIQKGAASPKDQVAPL